MPWTSKHTKWLKKTKEDLKTVDGKTVQVWEFRPEDDEEILFAWAKHFRNHYCSDDEIDDLRKGYNYCRAKYLERIKFPTTGKGLGPGIRAGDFGEILVADFLQYKLKYWVPRTRYSDKISRDESPKGCDIIGFKLVTEGKISPNDTLVIFETKTQFSGKRPEARLQDAVNDSAKNSAKNQTRKAESLNAIKQRLKYGGVEGDVKRVERFQDGVDRPYREISGAAALFDSRVFDAATISKTDTTKTPKSKKRKETHPHPNRERLALIVIKGSDMMNLVHELYRRAADEA